MPARLQLIRPQFLMLWALKMGGLLSWIKTLARSAFPVLWCIMEWSITLHLRPTLDLKETPALWGKEQEDSTPSDTNQEMPPLIWMDWVRLIPSPEAIVVYDHRYRHPIRSHHHLHRRKNGSLCGRGRARWPTRS